MEIYWKFCGKISGNDSILPVVVLNKTKIAKTMPMGGGLLLRAFSEKLREKKMDLMSKLDTLRA